MELHRGASYITKSQFPRNPTSMHRLVTISLWKSIDSWLQIDFLFLYHFHCSFPSLRTIVISTSTDYSSNPALHLRFQLWSIFSSHVELMQSYIIKYWTLKMKIKKYKKFAENAERRSAQATTIMHEKQVLVWMKIAFECTRMKYIFNIGNRVAIIPSLLSLPHRRLISIFYDSLFALHGF